jgi:nucleoside-diphosphate-sugar epimerase
MRESAACLGCLQWQEQQSSCPPAPKRKGQKPCKKRRPPPTAQWIIKAMENRAATVGEVFNAVSEQAVTLRGYAETIYRWFGRQPRIAFKPFDEWILGLGDYAENTRGHVIRSSSHSIDKSRQRLAYRPRYTSLQAVHESLQSLIANGIIVGH